MAKKVALYGLMTALAFVFAYVERLFPIPLGVPGIKLGLANLVVLLALLTLRVREAGGIALARILLSGLLFGNPSALLYALCGGLLSFAAMALLSRCTKMSTVAISVVGGILHNVGQIAAAVAVTGTPEILWYLSILIPTGTLTGALIGVCAQLLHKRVRSLALHFGAVDTKTD